MIGIQLRLIPGFAVLLLLSCGTSKNVVITGTDEAIVTSAVQVLKKHPGNYSAKTQLQIHFRKIVEKRLDQVVTLVNSEEAGRWERLLPALYQLQALSQEVGILPAYVIQGINHKDYTAAIESARDSIAEENYRSGILLLEKGGRGNAQMAYNNFKKVIHYVPGYKEVPAKMKEILDKHSVNIVLQPIELSMPLQRDGETDIIESIQSLQQRLVKDLATGLFPTDKAIPAKFYSPEEATSKNIRVDGAIHFSMRDFHLDQKDYAYTEEARKEVEMGRDTSNMPFYTSYLAVVRIVDRVYTATANFVVEMKDLSDTASTVNEELPVYYTWEMKFATYTGDARALDTYQWDLVNGYSNTSKNYDNRRVIHQLCDQAYSGLKEQIETALKW